MDLYPSFLQTLAWERVQQRRGHQTYWLDGTLFIRHQLKFGLSYWYAPRVHTIPDLNRIDQAFKREATFVKIEPQETTLKAPFSPTSTYQPRQTLILDLDKPEDALLASFKSKTRYNIRLAERKGVVVSMYEYPQSLELLPVFMKLTKETNLRDQITSHADSHYQALLEELGKDGMATIAVAYHENEPLASLILIRHEKVATYLFGASSNKKRDLMAPYLLQWEAIKYAQAKGDRYYDMWGVRVEHKLAPKETSTGVAAKNVLPYPGKTYGVTRFKLGFNGLVHFYPPAYDRSYNAFWYNLYKGYKSTNARKGFAY